MNPARRAGPALLLLLLPPGLALDSSSSRAGWPLKRSTYVLGAPAAYPGFGQAPATAGYLVGQAPATAGYLVGQAPATGSVMFGQAPASGAVVIGQAPAASGFTFGSAPAATTNVFMAPTTGTTGAFGSAPTAQQTISVNGRTYRLVEESDDTGAAPEAGSVGSAPIARSERTEFQELLEFSRDEFESARGTESSELARELLADVLGTDATSLTPQQRTFAVSEARRILDRSSDGESDGDRDGADNGGGQQQPQIFMFTQPAQQVMSAPAFVPLQLVPVVPMYKHHLFHR